MFVINTEITINYLLPHTTGTHLYTDFDMRIVQPNGVSTFYASAIQEENFIAPSPSTTGAVSYKFTPSIKGVWKVVLSKGSAPNFEVYNEYPIRVSSPDIHVYQQVLG